MAFSPAQSPILTTTAFLLFLLTPLCTSSISNPSVLPTPPMGFNNWARFECELNETLFTTTAHAMVTTGLRAAGYDRLNLDDCWMAYSRSENGSLQWNTTKFPHGIPWLSQYVRSHGEFHLGIYEDSGNTTCGGYPGSYGHEELDAATFASWGIDYLKLDGCNVFPSTEAEYRSRYGLWHKTLSGNRSNNSSSSSSSSGGGGGGGSSSNSTCTSSNRSGPQLIFSESAPAYFASDMDNLTDWYTVMSWVPRYGELARHSTDILVYVGAGGAWDSIMVNYNYNLLLARYQTPGYFNDPDFLIPDHQGLTLDEKRSHFALWASFSAPLIISAYIPDLPDEVLAFLKNRELIAVDQDRLGQQATLVSRSAVTGVDVLTRSLDNGDRLVTILNWGNQAINTTTIGIDHLGLLKGDDDDDDDDEGSSCVYTMRDLWTNNTSTLVKQHIEIGNLASHATAVYRVSPLSGKESCSEVIPTGMIFNTASKNCLTAGGGQTIGFDECIGADSQIWQVHSSSGTISPLTNSSICLTAQKGNSIALSPCGETDDDDNDNRQTQIWTYVVTGNLKNVGSGVCLTEASPSSAEVCGFELDTQVWALPSGVVVTERDIVAK